MLTLLLSQIRPFNALALVGSFFYLPWLLAVRHQLCSSSVRRSTSSVLRENSTCGSQTPGLASNGNTEHPQLDYWTAYNGTVVHSEENIGSLCRRLCLCLSDVYHKESSCAQSTATVTRTFISNAVFLDILVTAQNTGAYVHYCLDNTARLT